MKKVFISFARQQRDILAKPLSDCLSSKNITVWYDEYELIIGDKVRQKIDMGIISCDFGIIILSKDYFTNAWTNYEFEGLFTRDIDKKEKFLLPIWHEITSEEIKEKTPTLADRKGLPSSIGISKLCEEISKVINGPAPTNQHNPFFSFSFYQSRYYNPPSEIPRIGHKIDKQKNWIEMQDLIGSTEVLIGFFYNQVSAKVAAHIYSPEFMFAIERLYHPIEYYAVNIFKANEGFDIQISKEDIQRKINGS